MSYVGNTPALKYVNFAVQHFTTSATTSYTLDQSVSNEVEIALFINNVRQEPGSSYSYTATGTALTLSQATAGSDTMYCVFIGKAVETNNPPAGSVNTSELVDNAVSTAKVQSDAITYDKIQDLGTANRVLGGASTGTVGEVQVVDGMTNFVSTSSVAGLQIRGDGTTDGTLQLNCSQNTHGIKIKSPPHSATASYTLTMPTTDGNTSEFLQTNGSGVLTWADAGGGSLVKLSSTTFGTPATAVVFNNSLITSTYDNYKIFVSGLASSGDQGGLGILMSVDNGSSFATHVGSREYTQINGGSAGGWAGNLAFIQLGSDDESDATGSTNFEVTIYNVHDTSAYKFVSALGTVKNANGNYYGYRVHGYIASNTAVNYVKVYASGGQNLDKGTVTLYGIAK